MNDYAEVYVRREELNKLVDQRILEVFENFQSWVSRGIRADGNINQKNLLDDLDQLNAELKLRIENG